MTVDDIIAGIMSFGQGILLAKFDVESAFQIALIQSDDCYLFGMQWTGKYFIDMALPFGLRSAPYIFSSVADLAKWILTVNYEVNFLCHYLDDFHTLGPPNSPICQHNFDTSLCLDVLRMGYSRYIQLNWRALSPT